MLLRLLLVVAVVAFVWWVTRPRFDFTIRVADGEVSLTGRMAQTQWSQVSQFWRDQVARDDTRLSISGRRSRDGRLLLHFRGSLDAGQRQRIRNFLVELL